MPAPTELRSDSDHATERRSRIPTHLTAACLAMTLVAACASDDPADVEPPADVSTAPIAPTAPVSEDPAVDDQEPDEAPDASDTAVADGADSLDTALGEIVLATEVPALGAMAIDSDGVLGSGVAGVRARGSDTPVTDGDRFHIGSNTKAMTAALVGIVEADGVDVGFDTTMAEAFADLEVHDGYADVTIDAMLAHAGGAPVDEQLPAEILGVTELDVEAGRAEAARIVLEAPPANAPHAESVYSNAGYLIVGAALEAATGESWEDLMRTELFEPLEMTSCGFGSPGVEEELTEPRGHDAGGAPAFEGEPAVVGPAGTVHCSMEDWSSFLGEILRGGSGDGRVLDSDLVERLLTPIAPIADAPGVGYAMGWVIVDGPEGAVALHDGSNEYWFSQAIVAPGIDRAVLAVSNHEATGEVAVAQALELLAQEFPG